MLGLDIASFVIGTIADIWGIRKDNIEIREAKKNQEQQQTEKIKYPLDNYPGVKNDE